MQSKSTHPVLLVIDMQKIFQDPHSQWCCPEYGRAEGVLRAIVPRFHGKIIWTRFVRDGQEHGSWKAYYDRWDRCREEPDAPAWGLTMPVGPDDAVITRPTFSKWDKQLATLVSGAPDMLVGGVATDCCVLGTVLGAVDAGQHVTLIEDACAGATRAAHEQALSLMDMLSPMVKIAHSDKLAF